MNYITELVGGKPKYAVRRFAAVVLIGIPAEILLLKVLGLFIRVCACAGIF